MNSTRFAKLVEETIEKMKYLMVTKGGEYASLNDDRLVNFKTGAKLAGTTPLQTCLIYLSKHYDAVSTYVRDDAQGVDRVRSEPIDGRLDDLMNYCVLMKGLIVEMREPSPVREFHHRNVVNARPNSDAQREYDEKLRELNNSFQHRDVMLADNIPF